VAIAGAESAVEELRGESNEGIWDGIKAIEDLIYGPQDGVITPARLLEVQRLGDRIIFLSDTYELSALSRVTMGLCDLAERFIEIGKCDTEALGTFCKAMRKAAPRNSKSRGSDADTMLQELSRILVHYRVRS